MPPTIPQNTLYAQLVALRQELERHRDHATGDWRGHVADTCSCLDEAAGHLLVAIGEREAFYDLRAEPRRDPDALRDARDDAWLAECKALDARMEAPR